MKRFLTILLTTLALTAALCVTASASNFDGAAEELAAIGMFKGTADGFALDQAPTRAQAAIMLVRLYGAEQNAQDTYRAGRTQCPFTDVNETAAPDVAWLVDEGLANGTSDTTFGAADPCTARAYTIFLLRALGYEDGSDFTTGTAQSFAAGLGIVDTSAITGTFLRDDLAAMTYQALGTDVKDGSTYLLNHLIQEDYLDYNTAHRMVEKIENCRALGDASKSMEKGLAAGIDMDMAVTVSGLENDRVEHTTMSGKGQIKMLTGRNPQMSYDITMEENGQAESVQMWMRDGWLYTQTGEEALKQEMPKEMLESYQELMSAGATKNSGASMLPFLEYAEVKGSGSEKVYTLELNDAFGNMINSVIAQALQESGLQVTGEIALDNSTMTYTVRNDVLRTIDVDLSLSMEMGAEGQTAITIGLSLQMTMDITATGSAVKITYPDFSKFQEVIGGADGPTGIFGGAAA